MISSRFIYTECLQFRLRYGTYIFSASWYGFWIVNFEFWDIELICYWYCDRRRSVWISPKTSTSCSLGIGTFPELRGRRYEVMEYGFSPVSTRSQQFLLGNIGGAIYWLGICDWIHLKLKLNFIQILLEKITALKASYTAFVFSKGRRWKFKPEELVDVAAADWCTSVDLLDVTAAIDSLDLDSLAETPTLLVPSTWSTSVLLDSRFGWCCFFKVSIRSTWKKFKYDLEQQSSFWKRTPWDSFLPANLTLGSFIVNGMATFPTDG